jgi:hypothetical protein
MRKHCFSVFIELHDAGFCLLFERMPNDRSGLVVFDLDGIRPFLAAVVGPSQIPG